MTVIAHTVGSQIAVRGHFQFPHTVYLLISIHLTGRTACSFHCHQHFRQIWQHEPRRIKCRCLYNRCIRSCRSLLCSCRICRSRCPPGVPSNRACTDHHHCRRTRHKPQCVFLVLFSIFHSKFHFVPLLSNLKPISHSPDRLNILWLRRIKFDFFPNLLDMHRHRGDISDRFHIPDLIKQLFFCIHMIWILS